jgi:putative transposase
MKYEFIKDQREHFKLAEMCEALSVGRSSYHRWKSAKPTQRNQEDEVFKAHILRIHSRAKGEYGHRPIYHHLHDEGLECGRDRTLRLMQELSIRAITSKKFKPMSGQAYPGFGYSSNVLKEVGSPIRCNQAWVADTTYMRTEQGWCYLATVMDLYSRRIIGWSISNRNDTKLIIEAFQAAVLNRRKVPQGIIHHSDRGSTYASDRYQRMIKSFGLISSMSGKGNCYDNAAMESFFGRYKTSTVRDRSFQNQDQVRSHVFDYIEVFYNRFRKHKSLGYKSPLQFEQKYAPSIEGIHQQPNCFSNN